MGGRASDGWYRGHPKFETRLSPEQAQEIEDVLSAHGVTKRDFVVAAAREWASRRPPESQGGVKVVVDQKTIIVDMEDIEAAAEAVEREADQEHKIAAAFTDRAVRHKHLQRAGRYHNASMLLHQIMQAGARRRDGEVVHRSRGKQLVPANAPASIAASLPSTRDVG